MSVIWILVGFSIFVAVSFLLLFVWAVRNGQYDDKFTPSVRILFDDEKKNITMNQTSENKVKGSADYGNANDQVR
ncbi:MAG: cbb3-type cytochrome oxidase assembly protein CcoS [Ignavibacteriales bacterium]|nr:cbb3-type cytochrome oxidase assembly protein CcoS [Ignavibacteriales bacterium]